LQTATAKPRTRREWHLPDAAYLDPESDIALSPAQLRQAARVTARVVAREATRFESYAEGERRAGSLPRAADAREAMGDQVFAWLIEAEQRRLRPRAIYRLELHRGRSLLLMLSFDPRDLPARGVFLGPGQLATLQDALAAEGLPRDLYYRLSERRTVWEPVDRGEGRVANQYQHYSPRQWRQRDPSPSKALVVPSRSQRQAAFVAACESFLDELSFRDLVLLQQRSEQEEVQRVRDLGAHVKDVIDLTTGRSPHSFQRKPTAGWARPPTAWEALDSAWPALMRLHPGGAVDHIHGIGDPPESWFVWVADDRDTCYEIHLGVLYGPVDGTPTAPPARDPSMILTLADRAWNGLIDSDAATRIANETGARQLRRDGGQGILVFRPSRGQYWEFRISSHGKVFNHELRVRIDIRSGEVLEKEAERSLTLWWARR
jgi:hypothetical protein